MKYNKMKRPHYFAAVVAAAFVMALFPFAGNGLAWNFTVPAQEVKPVNGAFQFPVSAFADGKARHFVYKHSPKEVLRFFVVRSSDGRIMTAFDACDVCFRAKKGYVQQGNEMVCINCGLKFPTDKIDQARGGCNPGHLSRTIQGNNVIITVQDVLSGQKYFN